jgi:glycosyltransferase involved in cell wall biosynthesis
MKRLSIIIPIYKVEDYVERCLSSLLNQDLDPDQFEIICVNDGSPDRSGDIVKNLKKSFSNIQIIEQENQGVSSARNNGIDIATGKYLLFIDPDDFVEPNSLNRVLNNADNLECQASFLGFTVISESGKVVKRLLNDKHKDTIFNGTEAYYISRGNDRKDPDRMVAVLFRRDLFEQHKLRYLTGVPYLEDGEFIARILCFMDRCIFDGRPFYYRTIREGSATNSSLFYSERAINGFIQSATNLMNFKKNPELSQDKRDFLNQAICKFVIIYITSSARPFSIGKLQCAKERLCKVGLCKLDLKSIDLEYRILGHLYNFSVLALILYQFFLFRLYHVCGTIKLQLGKLFKSKSQSL